MNKRKEIENSQDFSFRMIFTCTYGNVCRDRLGFIYDAIILLSRRSVFPGVRPTIPFSHRFYAVSCI